MTVWLVMKESFTGGSCVEHVCATKECAERLARDTVKEDIPRDYEEWVSDNPDLEESSPVYIEAWVVSA